MMVFTHTLLTFRIRLSRQTTICSQQLNGGLTPRRRKMLRMVQAKSDAELDAPRLQLVGLG
ncbi:MULTISPECIES: hypothetical protein [Hyphomicrobiales]|jgi:hypothetical protein|uniref:Uncharacterized protein n=2 Tax=Hyphomicrobiales TaxID=356 RepID=A0A546XF44_AGRTU|nr:MULTISPECIES: hypothetical protein [Hyphomicrobiales]KAB2788689.1 hypothetical protein F9K96_16750 [Brucella anthropi]MBE0563543.1 hypothetical protein [Brucella anthropi]MBQ0708025.1 hypothetical protein [Ochrobactrum sp. AP1BH01-1]TRA99317.1 hypothetical protein EXN61_26400 [Agrobacterium tumefaciens]